MNTATKLNPVQTHLLGLFDQGVGETELEDIRKLLVQYYQQKIEQEVEEFWTTKELSTDSFATTTADLHLRVSNKEKL